MDGDVRARGKRPRTVLAGPYGHPLHPMLVTVPIGAWVASLLFDVASRSASDAFIYARGSFWLIVIGLVGAFAAAVVGVLDLLAIPRGTPAFRTGLLHLAFNDVVIALFAVSLLVRIGDTSKEVSVGLIVLSAVALAVLAVAGWLGGRLAYTYGVRVADEGVQAAGFTGASGDPSTAGAPAEPGEPGAPAEPPEPPQPPEPTTP